MSRYSQWLLFLTNICIALFTYGCDSGDLPEVTVLGDLRLLGLIADKPEANPSETVIVTPLISDLNGNGRTLTLSAAACIDPGIAVGAVPTCDNDPNLVPLAINQTVNGLTAPYYTGLTTTTVTVTLPDSSVIFANRTSDEQFNGVNYLVTVTLQAADGAITQGFRRLKVSTKTTKNSNPTYGSPPLTNNNNLLEIDLAAGVNENYDKIVNGTTVSATEVIETSWFVSDGTVQFTITNDETSNILTPPTTPLTSNSILIVVVTRDDRGGIATQQLIL